MGGSPKRITLVTPIPKSRIVKKLGALREHAQGKAARDTDNESGMMCVIIECQSMSSHKEETAEITTTTGRSNGGWSAGL